MRPILLLEDDETLGATLSERLGREGYLVQWVKDLRSGQMALEKQRFDLAILDVGLPDGSGFDWAKAIRETSLLPFIFVTARSGAEDRLRGYEIGAEEFIPKPFHLKELLLRVRHVLENHSPSALVEVGSLNIDIDRMLVIGPSGQFRLTLKEATVLKILVGRSPKAVSRDEILDLVWGRDEFPTQRTVDNVILRLRQVLGPEHESLIESVRGVGYRWIS